MVASDRMGIRSRRAVITAPLVHGSFDSRGSIQLPDVAAIRALADDLFPDAGTLPAKRNLAPWIALGGAVAAIGGLATWPLWPGQDRTAKLQKIVPRRG